MEEKINILLILKNENCLTEVIDFLLKSIYQIKLFKKTIREPRYMQDSKEYAYIGGPPTVFEGRGPNTLRVYFVLKSLDTIKSDINNITQSMYHYNAVVMSLGDEADAELILDFMRSPYYSNLSTLHSLTIIENMSAAEKTNLKNLRKVKSVDLSKYCTSSEWRWNGRIANHWSTHLQNRNSLWNDITKSNYEQTKISYNSEIMLRSIISVFDFFYRLMIITHSNIDVIAGGTETNSMYLITLTLKGDTYKQQRKQAKELLSQLNVLNLGDFDRLLKKEMEQLACQLSRLVILCDEIVNFTGDLHSQLFHNFSGLEQFEKIYYNELQGVNRENLTEAVFDSLDAMSEMKYTGYYIKNVFGIEKLNALKGFLKRPYSVKNILIDSLNVPTTIFDHPLSNEEKQDSQHKNRIQNIHIENRMGNVRLLKSLQKTLQEFMEELKDMRELQEQFTLIMTKDNRVIKEKLSNLEQDNRKLKENLQSTKEYLSNLEEGNRDLNKKLSVLERKIN